MAKIDRNMRLLTSGDLGHALDVSVGDLIDFIVAEVIKQIASV